MKTQTKIGIGVGLAVIAYLLLSKKASAATKTTTTTGGTDSNKTSGGVLTDGVLTDIKANIGKTMCSDGVMRTPEDCKSVGGSYNTGIVKPIAVTPAPVTPAPVTPAPVTPVTPAPVTPAPPVEVAPVPPVSVKPQPIDCELFPDNPACADVIKAPPVAITPPDDIPKRKIPEPIESPIDPPMYGGGGGDIIPPSGGYGGYGRYGGYRPNPNPTPPFYMPKWNPPVYSLPYYGQPITPAPMPIERYDPLPYHGYSPKPPKWNPPAYYYAYEPYTPSQPVPIGRYYAYDPLPYEPYTPPPVSYEPSPYIPIERHPYDPIAIYDDVVVKNLKPIDEYSGGGNYGGGGTVYSGGGGGGSISSGGGGGFFGGGSNYFGSGWMTDWGFGIPLSGGGRKGSVIVPPTDFDEYGNALM